jgi:hypothetical protein
MAAKPSKVEKPTKAPKHRRKNHQPPKHNRKIAKASQKTTKPRKHNRKIARAQSSNTVQPQKRKKPSMIKKMVKFISKRKLAWEATQEEGK